MFARRGHTSPPRLRRASPGRCGSWSWAARGSSAGASWSGCTRAATRSWSSTADTPSPATGWASSTCALTAADVDTAVAALPEVPAVALSSRDVHQASTGLRSGRCEAPVLRDDVLPPDLALTGAPPSTSRPTSPCPAQLLGWSPGDPAERVAASVRWHLAHPPDGTTWTAADAEADDRALESAW